MPRQVVGRSSHSDRGSSHPDRGSSRWWARPFDRLAGGVTWSDSRDSSLDDPSGRWDSRVGAIAVRVSGSGSTASPMACAVGWFGSRERRSDSRVDSLDGGVGRMACRDAWLARAVAPLACADSWLASPIMARAARDRWSGCWSASMGSRDEPPECRDGPIA